MQLEDKVIVVTGSSRGIGSALAVKLAQNGAIVIVNYCKSDKKAKETLLEIKKYSNQSEMFYADVTSDADVKAMYQYVMQQYGRIDVLINNAGKNNDAYVNLMSESQWNDVLTTNLTGIFLCCRYFSKAMIRAKKGKIINIASLKGQLGSEGQANYAASKAGVIGFSKSLAKELGPEGISVNVVCPGYIKTELNSLNVNKQRIAEEMSAMSIEYGLEDFVNFTTFLASDAMKGVSGQVYNIDSRVM